ncbi:hypothetical protein BdWA1_002522 [Babesia duncani]|uniref:Secreted protein n=1 Tax=Babesia duncani TaxID=323732 RepID=A0AAD9UNI6_9APIC|nr:hypothetical protein BdWA1_002522 [Babesia duncani]
MLSTYMLMVTLNILVKWGACNGSSCKAAIQLQILYICSFSAILNQITCEYRTLKLVKAYQRGNWLKG